MDTDIRLLAKIYRAIREFSSSAAIDEAKCKRIARLIRASDIPAQIEALVEQHADCIQAMSADEFVAALRERVVRENQVARLRRETAALV